MVAVQCTLEEANCPVHQMQAQEVAGGLEGDLAVQYVEEEWSDQTFEEQGLPGQLAETVVAAVLWVA